MRKCLLLLFLTLGALGLAAQERQTFSVSTPASFREQPLARRFSFAVNGGIGAPYRNTTPLFAGIDIGFECIPRLVVFGRAEALAGLHEVDDARTYAVSKTLGAGLGVRLLGKWQDTYATAMKHALDLRASVGWTYGKNDWNYALYDANLTWYCRGVLQGCSPTVGVGFRYMDSRTSGIRSYRNAYLTIGFRF